MSEVEDRQIYPMWRTALARLIEAQERLESAGDAEKVVLKVEYDDALTAYLAVVDEL